MFFADGEIRPGHFGNKMEKVSFAVAVNFPIRRHALETFVKTFTFAPIIKITPRRVLAHGGDEIVRRLFEIVIVVFVE
ncbi:MAG TPA: hypothetical protein VNX46_10525, partial [Candidatus Acidoferrum sp.]|nr:hypothetical protein [Candidatus Acidoferrum sp.]